MGETYNQSVELSFHRSLKVAFQGSRVTSDGGLILVRELDERLGFSGLIEQDLTDFRGRTRSCLLRTCCDTGGCTPNATSRSVGGSDRGRAAGHR